MTAFETIEDVVGAFPDWQGRTARYAPVGGGISNTNWRVWIDGSPGSFFVKIPGRGTEMFINRRAAVEASRRAEAIGIGPRVYPFEDGNGIEIADFIEGRRTASNRDFLRPTVRAAVVDTYRTLHGSGPFSLTKTAFDMIDEHLAQIGEVGATAPDWTAPLLARYGEARRAIEAAGLDLVPCFNDPMPGNFLLGAADDLILIDYEYASNNDRCYDFAAWSTEMFFDATVEAEIVERYFGRPEPRVLCRITAYKALADLKWGLWATIQNEISSLDFDFYKYGLWKFLRARSVFEAPSWPAVLRGL
ncbi:MAG TPA: choline/ethanolamine kinase family protein [Xanthobacteraceae bacterium]|nr:choline/ethanolamine kinase family protein [Xanthobacteraceae bacterium]